MLRRQKLPNISAPRLQPPLPNYPVTRQFVRVEQSLGSVSYGFVQQFNGTTPRDREACYIIEPNNIAFSPGKYKARLIGSHSGAFGVLPLFAVSLACCSPGSSFSSSSAPSQQASSIASVTSSIQPSASSIITPSPSSITAVSSASSIQPSASSTQPSASSIITPSSSSITEISSASSIQSSTSSIQSSASPSQPSITSHGSDGPPWPPPEDRRWYCLEPSPPVSASSGVGNCCPLGTPKVLFLTFVGIEDGNACALTLVGYVLPLLYNPTRQEWRGTIIICSGQSITFRFLCAPGLSGLGTCYDYVLLISGCWNQGPFFATAEDPCNCVPIYWSTFFGGLPGTNECGILAGRIDVAITE